MRTNYKKGFVIPLIIAIVAIFAIGGMYYFYQEIGIITTLELPSARKINIATTTQNNIVGGDKDSHGCIGSSGYFWCELKNKCLRVWEEKCEVTNIEQIDSKTISNNSNEILPNNCIDKPESKAVITSLSSYSGSVGTKLEIKGCNFSGFEGDKNVIIENSKGETGILRGEYDSTSKIIKVTLKSPLCSQDNSYSGLPCSLYLTLIPGTYKMWTMPWGENTKSNFAIFIVTP